MSSEGIIDPFYVHVGDKLRLERKNAGMDQETLSRHLNLSRTTVINIEKGRQRLSLEHAWLASQILNISIEDLLPPKELKTVDEWVDEVQKSTVTGKVKKDVINWIKSQK